MTDRLTTVSAYNSVLAYPVYTQEHETAAKGNQSFSLYDSRACSDNCLLLEPIMEPNKKSSAKCGDALHKGSSFLSFISLLLIVWLFLRLESINRKTEMNEMRISKVESRVQTELLQTTDHKNDMETLESKYKRTIGFTSLYSSLVNS